MAKLGLLLSLLLSACIFADSGSSDKKQFHHADTGYPLEGFHNTLNCNDCHRDGQFKGTPSECFDCHSMNGFLEASFKPADHLMSTQDCQACHIPTLWEDIIRYDHTQALGPCASCHIGQSDRAPTKPPEHPLTSNNCDTCHSDTAWQPVFFNHGGVLGSCISCHNGIDATGQHPGHIETNGADCVDCHYTAYWIPTKLSN